MKNIFVLLFLLITNVIKSQPYIKSPHFIMGGSAGYSTVANSDRFVVSTWVNYVSGRKKEFNPMIGVGMMAVNMNTITNRYFVPQLQAGIVSKSGLVAYTGIDRDKKISIGFGFYAGYQQFRMEYCDELNTLMFGTGYLLR